MKLILLNNSLRSCEVTLGQTERGESQPLNVDASGIAPEPEIEVGEAMSRRHQKAAVL